MLPFGPRVELKQRGGEREGRSLFLFESLESLCQMITKESAVRFLPPNKPPPSSDLLGKTQMIKGEGDTTKLLTHM